jgi:competence protein ComEC
MFTVYLLARLLGRQRSVLPSLALAAAIMLALEPTIISSISFQLSFAAVLGIALFSAKIAGRSSASIQESASIPSFAKRLLTGIVYGMSVSLAATIATAPLVAFHFGEVPIWGIPSTLLIVPVLPVFIGGSLLVAVTGAISEQPIAIAGILSHGIGNYMSFIASFFANLPIGPITSNGWSMTFITGWYAVMLVLLNRRVFTGWFVNMRDRYRAVIGGTSASANSFTPRRRRTLYLVIALWLIAAISLFGFVVSKPDSTDLSVTFFETNRGDMIFVETPSGTRLLIDGGDDPDLAIVNIESVLPPLDRRIDVLLSTHPDADHLGGLQQVVEQFDVRTIIDSGVPHNSNIYRSWAQLLRNEPNVITAQPDMIVALDDDLNLRILQTRCVVVECTNFNDEGVVARLEYREVSFLLTGDVTSSGENDLIQTGQPIKSSVLKAGHHGSRTSTTQQFLEAVDPALAIVTTGIKNQFGHPHEDVIQRLENHLSPEAVFVTRNNGTLTVTTNGRRVWITTER